MAYDLTQLKIPIVQAPMAGGPSTVELTAAVGEAGGLGFLAAGYRSPEALRGDIRSLRHRTEMPFGVNIFAPPPRGASAEAVSAYARSLAEDARRLGAELGAGRSDDDGYATKVELVAAETVPVVSFTFGRPERSTIDRLHDAGAAVWVTVTDPQEARAAEDAGADALVVQGTEAGGHRAAFDDEAETEEFGLLALLRLIARQTRLGLVATGGIMDGAAVAAVLCAGASAAQLGSTLMLTPEAGTSAAHRERLAAPGPTRMTRAFSGRRARGIVNRFMIEHERDAPAAYPEVHHLTAPLRAAARRDGNAEAINLWAGQAHTLAEAEPAADLVRRIAAEAAEAAAEVARRLSEPPRQ